MECSVNYTTVWWSFTVWPHEPSTQTVVELWSYIPKLTTEKRTDGQTRCLKDDHFQQVVQCVEGKSESKKQHTVPNLYQNRRPYQTQTLFQFSASPARILGTTENASFVHFIKKSMHLKTGFLSDYQVLFLLLNGPKIKTSLLFNRSISNNLWRQNVATHWFCPFPLKRGNL